MSDHLSSPTRRRLLGSAAAALGMSILSDFASGDDNPAAAVEDRTTTIVISSVRAIPTGPKCYVKIETNHGVTGWGEITGSEPNVAKTLVESWRELLIDQNPTRIEHLWQKIFRSHRDLRGGGFMCNSLAAVDMALWDITGKLWGVPVYRLLGGPLRDTVRMYPSPVARKLGTGGPHPFSANPDELERLANMVRQAREQLGPSGTIMFDAHSAVPPPMLIQFASMVEPYNLLFLEEPAVPGNIDVFKRLKQSIRIPMATGERDRTIWGTIPYLTERCIDIFQPDVGHTGGISQMRKIAALCEAFTVPLAPHNTCSELGLTAGLHCAFATPFFLIQEGYLDGHIMPPGVARKTWTVDDKGNASLPQEPGLGVEMDEQKMAEVNADPKRQFKWPKRTAPDGSIIDY